jgi:multidrug resistance efflux pump
MSQPDIDELPALVDALRRKVHHLEEQLDETEADLQAARGRIAHLEKVINPDEGERSYQQMTKAQKIYRVRTALVDEAVERETTTVSMDYKEVRWLFNGSPSPGHAYNLMEAAAELDGFGYDEDREPTRVTVNLDALNDETLIHRVNKAVREEQGVADA